MEPKLNYKTTGKIQISIALILIISTTHPLKSRVIEIRQDEAALFAVMIRCRSSSMQVKTYYTSLYCPIWWFSNKRVFNSFLRFKAYRHYIYICLGPSSSRTSEDIMLTVLVSYFEYVSMRGRHYRNVFTWDITASWVWCDTYNWNTYCLNWNIVHNWVDKSGQNRLTNDLASTH